MEQARSAPEVGRRLRLSGEMESRWPSAERWGKYAQNVNGVEIHYVWNGRQVDDFKFKRT